MALHRHNWYPTGVHHHKPWSFPTKGDRTLVLNRCTRCGKTKVRSRRGIWEFREVAGYDIDDIPTAILDEAKQQLSRWVK